MTKNKRFEWCEEIKGNFVDEYVKDNVTGKSLDEEDMFHLLNEQEETIQNQKGYILLLEQKLEENGIILEPKDFD